MAVPSEMLTPMCYTSRGKGYEYWVLLCKQGGSDVEFEMMCRGGRIAEKAIETIKTTGKEGRRKDQLRTQVASQILKAISTYFKTTDAVREPI
jgi:hypothetical protein